MNSQDQEISELRRTLPEEHTQQIIILLGRMIHHRLTETGNSTGTTTGKGLVIDDNYSWRSTTIRITV